VPFPPTSSALAAVGVHTIGKNYTAAGLRAHLLRRVEGTGDQVAERAGLAASLQLHRGRAQGAAFLEFSAHSGARGSGGPAGGRNRGDTGRDCGGGLAGIGRLQRRCQRHGCRVVGDCGHRWCKGRGSCACGSLSGRRRSRRSLSHSNRRLNRSNPQIVRMRSLAECNTRKNKNVQQAHHTHTATNVKSPTITMFVSFILPSRLAPPPAWRGELREHLVLTLCAKTIADDPQSGWPLTGLTTLTHTGTLLLASLHECPTVHTTVKGYKYNEYVDSHCVYSLVYCTRKITAFVVVDSFWSDLLVSLLFPTVPLAVNSAEDES